MASPAVGTIGSLAFASRTNSAVPVPASVAINDIILVYLYINSTTAITPPAGFIEITFATVPQTTGTVSWTHVFWKRAAAADTGTYSFTHATASTEVAAIRFTGASTSGTPFEAQTGAQRSSAGTTAPAVSLTTTGTNRLLVYSMSSTAVGAETQPTGFTEQYDSGSGGMEVATLVQSAIGSTASLTGTGVSGFMTATLLALFGAESYTASPSDPLGMTDSMSAVQALNPTVVDTLGLTDSMNANHGLVLGPDSMSMTDAIAIGRGPNPADAMGITDSAAFVQQMSRAPSDYFGMTDNMNAVITHAELIDYQWVVAEVIQAGISSPVTPYVPFGYGESIVHNTFDPGSYTTRPQDVDASYGDYRVFGTDYVTPPTWGWQLYTDQFNPADSLLFTDMLKQVWKHKVRKNPNDVVRLRYGLAGRRRCVFGRPRRFTPVPDKIQFGKTHIVCDFVLSEDCTYDDLESAVIVPLAPATTASSGLVLPSALPWHFSTGPAPQTYQAIIGGTADTWVDVIFSGPVVNPWVTISGRTFGVIGTVPLGKTLTLSGKPWQTGLMLSDGTWVSGWLDPRSRLSALHLSPGQYAVTYGGVDITGTSSCTVKWRNAYEGL